MEAQDVTVYGLARLTKNRVPAYKIHSWLNVIGHNIDGTKKYGAATCLKTEWEDVQRALELAIETGTKRTRSQDSNLPKEKSITPDDLIELESEIERTGCGGWKLHSRHGLPKPLVHKIETWRRAANPENKKGVAKSCAFDEWKTVMDLLKSLPTIKKEIREDITDKMREKFRKLVDESGVSTSTIATQLGLSPSKLSKWYLGDEAKNGRITTCVMDEWNKVIRAYESEIRAQKKQGAFDLDSR